MAHTDRSSKSSLDPDVVLTIASLASILLLSFHLADDVVRKFEPGGFKNVRAILTVAVWLYGTLALAGRRSGYIIILLGSILGTLVPLAHMRGAGIVGGRIVGSSGILFWVWTLLALGVTATVSAVLAARALTARSRPVEQAGGGANLSPTQR